MHDVLATLKSECPEINNVYFRQDNAGCYHSAHTILSCPAIAKSVRMKIVRIDFSDPQGGKGAANKLAATCKAHIRAYINEGHDVVTAENMKDALQSSGGIQGVRVVTMQTIHSSSSNQRKIPNINQLNNFQFDGESITAWRSYGIGKGKKVEQVSPLKGQLLKKTHLSSRIVLIMILYLLQTVTTIGWNPLLLQEYLNKLKERIHAVLQQANQRT